MMTSLPSSDWDRVEKNDGSHTIVRCDSFLSRNLLIRSRSSVGVWPSESNGKSRISFQSSRHRSDSSGSTRTLVNSTSHARRLPRHRKLCEMNNSS